MRRWTTWICKIISWWYNADVGRCRRFTWNLKIAKWISFLVWIFTLLNIGIYFVTLVPPSMVFITITFLYHYGLSKNQLPAKLLPTYHNKIHGLHHPTDAGCYFYTLHGTFSMLLDWQAYPQFHELGILILAPWNIKPASAYRIFFKTLRILHQHCHMFSHPFIIWI